MFNIIIALQIISIFILFFELLYIAFQKPSKTQTILLIMVFTTIITLTGYVAEMFATTQEAALLGVGISYVGKPFALFSSFLFIAYYAGLKINKVIIAIVSVFCSFFPVMILSDKLRPLYYSTVSFDDSKPYSPLSLGHGPLYHLYTAYVVLIFVLSIIFVIKAIINAKNKVARHQTYYLFGTFGSTLIGYLLYLFKLTSGYDTTMLGCTISVYLIFILFAKYRIFDSLTLAKEKALDNATSGLLVFNENNQISYTNDTINSLLNDYFSSEELSNLPSGKSIVKKVDKVFEVSNYDVISGGRNFGKILEVIDITEKHNYSTKLELEVDARTKELRNVQRSIVSSFANIVEARDSSTGEHINRITLAAELLAKKLKDEGKFSDEIDDAFIERLGSVACLHDIGKLKIPDSVLLKPGKLTNEEFELIKTHTTQGGEIIRECLGRVERPEYIEMAEKIALYHHEKWNGTGYPECLSRDSIPLSARITAVVDVYDALRSDRCYKAAMSQEEAISIILEGKGQHFDPTIVDAFITVIPEIEAQRAHK